MIDVQNFMFSADNPVYDAEAVLMRIKLLIGKAESAGIPVLFIQHTGAGDKPMRKGKYLWRIHPDIEPAHNDDVILKYTPDCFYETCLRDRLNLLNVENLIIAGMMTEICVDTTCRKAWSLGYNVVIAKDSHSTFDSGKIPAEMIIAHHNNIFESWFAMLENADEIKF